MKIWVNMIYVNLTSHSFHKKTRALTFNEYIIFGGGNTVGFYNVVYSNVGAEVKHTTRLEVSYK